MGLFKILSIIFLALILIIVGVGIYFYNFHTFATLRICIGNESVDSLVTCSDNEGCREHFLSKLNELDLDSAPNVLKKKVDVAFEKAVICETTCKVKNIRGADNPLEVEYCETNEEEVKFDVKGKHAFSLMKYKTAQVISGF